MVFPLGSNISDWQIVERRYISEPDSQPILLLGDEMLAIWMCWRKRIILLKAEAGLMPRVHVAR